MQRLKPATFLFLFAVLTAPLAAQTPGTVQGILVDMTKDEATPTGSITVAVAPANVSYSFYEGSFIALPNFSELKPKYTGQMYGFDLAISQDYDNFAMSFDSYLKIDADGTYRFYLTSDDGSKLFIDDKLVVNNDGVHAPTTVMGSVKLSTGMHKLKLGYFQHLGGADLRLQMEGPGVTKQDITPYLYLWADSKAAPAKTLKFVVNETTRFETVRGNFRQKANFLKEHVGQRVDVFPQPGTAPTVAAKVDIVLPLPPPEQPAHVKGHPAGPRPVFGTVVEVTKETAKTSAITIRLHEPPPPVRGVVVDVSVSPDKELGYVTLKANGQDLKYAIPASGRIFKWKGYDFQLGSFLSIERGQTVILYPLPHDLKVSTRVDIMENPSEALHRARYHHRHHHVTFLTTSDTLFVPPAKVSRSSRRSPPSRWAKKWASGRPNVGRTSRKVDVFLPPPIQGVVTSLSAGNIGLKTETRNLSVAFNAQTVVEMVDNKVATTAPQTALAVGEKLVVLPAGPAPHVAEKLIIHLQRYTVKGQLLKSGGGSILVQVNNPAVGASPAFTSQDTFQIGLNTKFELIKGSTTEPATAAALSVAKDVIIQAKDLVPPVAEKVSITVPPVVYNGHVQSVGKGTVTVKVHYPAKDGKPARDANETFQVNATTKYELLRGTNRQSTNALVMQAGKETFVHGYVGSPVLDKVVILGPPSVPITVRGLITGTGTGYVTVKAFYPEMDGKPAQEAQEKFQINPSAIFEINHGAKKKKEAGSFATLQVGREVVVSGQTGPPLTADRLEIFLPIIKAINITGSIISVTNTSITIKAKDGNHTFQITAATKIEAVGKVKGKTPPPTAVLQPGRTVVIHGHTDSPNPVADKIDIKATKK